MQIRLIILEDRIETFEELELLVRYHEEEQSEDEERLKDF